MAQTIGDRNSTDNGRTRWADLQDSSCENLGESQNSLPAALLHTDSYVDTPEPSFDHPQGSVLCNLRRATALESQPEMDEEEPPAAKSKPMSTDSFVETPEPSFDYHPPARAATAFMETEVQAAAPSSVAWQPNAEAPTFIPMEHNAAADVRESASPARPRLRERSEKRLAPGNGNRVVNKRPRQDEGASSSASAARPEANATAGGTEPLQVSDEDWARRHEKRLNVVTGIRSTTEYEVMAGLRSQGRLAAAPSTPDAFDRQISKRKWEAEVMHWRNHLREFTAFGAPNAVGTPQAPREGSPERRVILPTIESPHR